MIEIKNVNYEELNHMDLEKAKEIIENFDATTYLEDSLCCFNGESYTTIFLDESEWDDDGKYQYKTEYGLLCKLNKKGEVVVMYDICVVNNITRCGSYFSEYSYENEFRVKQLIKKVVPKVVIPEHTVITIEK